MAVFFLPFAFEFCDKNDMPSVSTSNSYKFVLVVLPLAPLIRDQTQNLKKKKISCISLNDPAVSSKLVREGNHCSIFSSPESVLDEFHNNLKSLEFQRMLRCVVVDESHCIVNRYVATIRLVHVMLVV